LTTTKLRFLWYSASYRTEWITFLLTHLLNVFHFKIDLLYLFTDTSIRTHLEVYSILIKRENSKVMILNTFAVGRNFIYSTESSGHLKMI